MTLVYHTLPYFISHLSSQKGKLSNWFFLSYATEDSLQLIQSFCFSWGSQWNHADCCTLPCNVLPYTFDFNLVDFVQDSLVFHAWEPTRHHSYAPLRHFMNSCLWLETRKPKTWSLVILSEKVITPQFNSLLTRSRASRKFIHLKLKTTKSTGYVHEYQLLSWTDHHLRLQITHPHPVISLRPLFSPWSTTWF